MHLFFTLGYIYVFFAHAFGERSLEHDQAEALLEVAFKSERDRQAESNEPEPVTTSSVHCDSPPSIFDPTYLDFYNEVSPQDNLNELDRYIQGIGPMKSPNVNNPQHALDWWRVSPTCLSFYHFHLSPY